jgi:hypothetical protein
VMKVSVMFEIMILLMVWILNCDMGFVTWENLGFGICFVVCFAEEKKLLALRIDFASVFIT